METYKHILVAVDLSPMTQNLIQRGKQLAELYNCRLSLIHVLQAMPPVQTFGEMPLVIDMSFEQDLVLKARKDLEELAKAAQVPANTLCEVQEGSTPANDIAFYAAEHQVDLIIMGHTQQTGLKSFLLGSTAQSVAKQVKCDLFIMQSPQA